MTEPPDRCGRRPLPLTAPPRPVRLRARVAMSLVTFASVALIGGARSPVSASVPASAAQQVDLSNLNESLQSVVDAVLPSVVQILVSGYNVAEDRTGSAVLSLQRKGGSGVIVDPDGLIVTNAHVVDGARRIQVWLPALMPPVLGRRSILKPTGELAEATLVGLDRETDLAVLQVQRRGLPALEWFDSDDVGPGMLVLAFGSPFGLHGSVSLGIVSAQARQLRPDDPMIYIQTDAPINPGNSGGPLVSTDGRVVGINTMIMSQGGGSDGIGFAAPSNIVRFVYEQIRDTHRVRRGVIGVSAQTIDPLLARGLGLPQDWGVILADVLPGSPAAAGGLRVGDLVLALNGKRMENARQFDVNLYRQEIGRTVALEVQRGGEVQTLRVRVIERTDEENPLAEIVTPERNLVPGLGLLAIDLGAIASGQRPLLRISTGVLVAGIHRQVGPGPGFASGDVIHSLNNVSITNLEQLQAELAKLDSLAPAVLQVERHGRLVYVVLEIE